MANMKASAVSEDPISLSPRSRFRAAIILAMAADALQILVFPLFAEGAFSPADDVLDFAVAAVLVRLLGWHWEFLPAFLAELVPGVDLVPFYDGGHQRLSQMEADDDHSLSLLLSYAIRAR
jgi:hypothetical protein